MEEYGCLHLESYVNEKGLNIVFDIYSFYVKPMSAHSPLYYLCFACNELSSQVHACISCSFIGCYDTNHIQVHAAARQHFLSIDIGQGRIFCFECGLYIDALAVQRMINPLKERWANSSELQNYDFWPLDPEELDLIAQIPKSILVFKNPTLKFLNVGNTCFINCIIQALLNTPLLQNYFFLDEHECLIEDCFVCAFHDLFEKFHLHQNKPLLLLKFYYMVATYAPELSGLRQQDAHEFFMAVLNLLHLAFPDKVEDSSSNRCDCIIDKVFKGVFQSDVVCQKCRNVSTTMESFRDISLDIVETKPRSLTDCLEKFTRPEHLGPDAKVLCSNCKTHEEVTKQFTINKLPLTATFHLKRFEHSEEGRRKKIRSYVQFPHCLNMAPFVAKYRNNPQPVQNPSRYFYSLYAVICHSGNLNSGHFTAYIRYNNEVWLKCNDDVIEMRNPADVLLKEAYQLFYHKQIIE